MLYIHKDFDNEWTKSTSDFTYTGSIDTWRTRLLKNSNACIYVNYIYDSGEYRCIIYVSTDDGFTWIKTDPYENGFGIDDSNRYSFNMCSNGTEFVVMWYPIFPTSANHKYYFQKSTDGIHWSTPIYTSNLNPSSQSYTYDYYNDHYLYITYGNGIYVVAGEDGQNAPISSVRGGNVSISTDLVNWNNVGQKLVKRYQESGYAQNLSDGLFFKDGYFYYLATVTSLQYNITPEKYMFSWYAYKSADGINWEMLSPLNYKYSNCPFNNDFDRFVNVIDDKFVFITRKGYTGTSNDYYEIWESEDGFNWKCKSNLDVQTFPELVNPLPGTYIYYMKLLKNDNNYIFFSNDTNRNGLVAEYNNTKLYDKSIRNNWRYYAVANPISVYSNQYVNYANGIFISQCLGEDHNWHFIKSEDGVNWTDVNSYSTTYFVKICLNYNNMTLVAVDSSLRVSTTNANLSNWSWSTPTYIYQNSSINLGAATDMVFGNGKLVVLTSRGYITTSTDGTNWTTPTRYLVDVADEDGYNTLIWDGNRYIATNGYRIWTSTDATSWTQLGSDDSGQYFNQSEYKVLDEWNGFEYIRIGSKGSVITSQNYQHWTLKRGVDSNFNLTNPTGCYGNGIYVLSDMYSNYNNLKFYTSTIPYDEPYNPKIKKLYTFVNGEKKYLIK